MRPITHIFDKPDGDELLLTLFQGFSFSTGKHGYHNWRVTLDVGKNEAQRIYNWPGVPHVLTVDRTRKEIWEGRLEDIAIKGSQVTLGAFGYWRALTDVPYTAMWSKTGSGDWRASSDDEIASYKPDKYNIDNNNRLYISLKKNQSYSNLIDAGAMTIAVPHNSERDLVSISYDYDIKLPTNWSYRLFSVTDGFGSAAQDQSLTGNGSSQTGSHSVTLTSGKQRIIVTIRNATGGTYTNTGEDDDWYMKLTNVRILTQSTQVLASDIASSLVTHVNSINPDQLSGSSVFIEDTAVDLRDESYEDKRPSDILDRLALLHNYETGVWEGRRLHFRPQGSGGKTWFATVRDKLEAQRSLERVANSAYCRYRDASGRILRTAVSDDAVSKSRFGLIRRDYVDAHTTSQIEAEAHRDAMLSDRANDYPRIRLEIDRLEEDIGTELPLYHIRAGDTLVLHDFLPNTRSEDDAMSTFTVGETEYNVDRPDQILILSREPLPTLTTLVARREAGIR